MNFLDIILWAVYLVSLYFSVFLLLVFLDKKSIFRHEKSRTKLKEHPPITVIVPAFNEEETIIKTLDSIAKIKYPKNKLEVIVVNDGSTDATKEKVESFISKIIIENNDDSKWILINQKNAGKAKSLNNALKKANGKYFACLDADSFVDSLTLRKMLAMFEKDEQEEVAIITPAMKVYKPETILEKIQWLEYLVIILIARVSSHLDSLYVAPGPFSLYRTEVIKNLGGFDEKSLTEDQEIAYRVQKAQLKIRQCFDGYVFTKAPGKLKPFYRQRRRWYLGSISSVYQYKELMADKKYGDFGFIQMIKNVAGYFLAITGLLAVSYLFLIPLLTRIKNLFLVKFNIIPYITNFKLDLSIMDFLTLDFRKGIIIISLFMVGFFFFHQAHRNAQEKISKFGWIPLIPYFLFYYVLKGAILLLSLAEFSKSRRVKW